MSYCLSNLSISHPISSKFPHSRIPQISGKTPPRIKVKAAADDGRESLDQLQRQNNNNNNQQQPLKNRTASAAPIGGLWSNFPTARSVQQMMETMERMMDDPFLYWPSPPPPAETASYGRGRMPWEIIESEAAYKLRFDMPGMTKEDVRVWVEEKMLVVKAEKAAEKKGENDEGWSEKSYGKYSSRIALPENVEFEKIKAEVKDGVLYITIPKASRDAKVLDISVG